MINRLAEQGSNGLDVTRSGWQKLRTDRVMHTAHCSIRGSFEHSASTRSKLVHVHPPVGPFGTSLLACTGTVVARPSLCLSL
jgi:hypothetical protein